VAYNEQLAERIRAIVGESPSLSETKMFGGIAFMVNGNMFCGVIRDDLMARVGPDRHEEALASPGARLMDFAARPMKGMVFVSPEGYGSDEQLRGWVEQTLEFASSLPVKKAKRP
jgi:TfoX/Sxy family transcriptional regulator of competence genes